MGETDTRYKNDLIKITYSCVGIIHDIIYLLDISFSICDFTTTIHPEVLLMTCDRRTYQNRNDKFSND